MNNQGSLNIHVAQCMPFGPPRVGKTCLLYRLVHKHPPGKPATISDLDTGSPSTQMLDKRRTIHVTLSDSVQKPIIANTNKWKEIESLEEETAVLVKTVEKHSLALKANHDVSAITLPTLTKHATSDDLTSKDIISKQAKECTEGIDDIDMTEIPTLSDSTMSLYYTDTGGQPEFQEVLPALVAGPTIFLFIFSLFGSLNCKYRVDYHSADTDMECPYNSSFSVKEVFMQCLSSIDSHYKTISQDAAKKDSSVPPLAVVMVGTCKDLVGEEELSAINKEVMENDVLHRGIEPWSIGKPVIPVNNYDDKHDDAAEVRNVVERIIRREVDGKSPYNINFPVCWLAFELSLRKMSKSTMTYAECVELAKRCNISKEDLPNCLWFLHHRTGTIRYYGSVKELEDIIIIRPSVISRAISELITSTFTLKNVNQSEIEQFQQLGLFNSETVRNIFQRQKDKIEIPYEKFIALLSHLNILGHPHNLQFSHYFLPCALVHAEESLSSSDTHDPLLLFFEGEFVPKGVFSALLVFLYKAKWKIQLKKSIPLLFRNQASFFDCDNCGVTLTSTVKCFEVRMDCNENDSWYNTRKTLQKGIAEVCNSLQYDKLSSTQRMGFYCNLSECEDDVKHIAVVDNERGMFEAECSHTRKKFHLNKERKHWIATSKQG